MTDNLTLSQRKKTMQRVRAKNTKPEMLVRRLIHGMGYRYRLHRADLPGKPDLVFTGRRKVIFVHGCFWHGHDCKAGQNKPVSNTGYWEQKLRRNVERDRAHRSELKRLGWDSLVVWECQLRDLDKLKTAILSFLG